MDILYTRTVPIRIETDVFVAGGGPSGVAAAIAAARCQMKVFLAENNGSFGGAATVGLVPSFAQFTDGKNFLADGIGREVFERLFTGRGIHEHFIPFSVEKLKFAYDQMVTEAGVRFSFFTRLIDVIIRDDHIESVILASKSGIFAVKAKIYIDCTGDGDLSAFAGAEVELGNDKGETMPATLCSLWAGIDFSKDDIPVSAKLDEAFRDGVFTHEDRHIPGIQRTDPAHGIGGGNIGHCYEINPLDEQSLTRGMVEGRQIAREFERFYRDYLHGYENLYLCYTADQLGIRESRRIVCDYRLTGEDFVRRATFPDEIGRYAYPVDIHAMKPDHDSYEKFQKEYSTMRYTVGESYGIPYRCLTPKGISNLLCAGRCVGTDRQMQASIRVMPGCFITGQAAGVAASLAAQTEDVRSFPIGQLQDRIRQLGGYIP